MTALINKNNNKAAEDNFASPEGPLGGVEDDLKGDSDMSDAGHNHSSSPEPAAGPSQSLAGPPGGDDGSLVRGVGMTPLKMPQGTSPGSGLPTAPGTPGTPGATPGPTPVPQTPTGAAPSHLPSHQNAFETDLPPELLQQGERHYHTVRTASIYHITRRRHLKLLNLSCKSYFLKTSSKDELTMYNINSYSLQVRDWS